MRGLALISISVGANGHVVCATLAVICMVYALRHVSQLCS